MSVVAVVAEFVVLAIFTGVDLSATVGALTVASLALAAAFPALGGWQPFAPRPQLELDLELAGPACGLSANGRPWIDIEAISEEQRDAAWATAPLPDTPLTRTLGLSSSALVAFSNPLNPPPSATNVERFEQRIEEYDSELRAWLAELDAAIWTRCSQLELRVVVRNVAARAPARDLDVDVDLAAGLVKSTGPVDVETPPRRPKWHRSAFALSGVPVLSPYSRALSHVPLVRVEDVRSHPSGSGSRWAVRLPTLLHAGAVEPSSELELQVVEPGRFTIEAVARTTSLDEPVVRSVSLEIPDTRGRRLATLSDVTEYLDLDLELDEDAA